MDIRGHAEEQRAAMAATIDSLQARVKQLASALDDTKGLVVSSEVRDTGRRVAPSTRRL